MPNKRITEHTEPITTMPNNQQWIERYAHRLNEGKGDLSQLSLDERKHFRILLREYETTQQLAVLSERLSQPELPLGTTEE